MTLIVGFKCGSSVVLCADSQETRGNLKTEVNKLPIRSAEVGGMDIVCGGAGQGELTDSFRSRLLADMPRSRASGEAAIRDELEKQLVRFHRGSVFTAFPGTDEDKYIAGLIAVRSALREVFLFRFFGPVIEVVDTYGLAGEDYVFIQHLVKRRYRERPSINQAVLIGVEVVNEAKATSVYVGGPTRVVIVTPEGIQEQDNERVAWTESEIITQNRLIDDLRFDLASTGEMAQERLRNFSNSITSMRGVYGSKYPAWPQLTLGTDRDDDPFK